MVRARRFVSYFDVLHSFHLFLFGIILLYFVEVYSTLYYLFLIILLAVQFFITRSCRLNS